MAIACALASVAETWLLVTRASGLRAESCCVTVTADPAAAASELVCELGAVADVAVVLLTDAAAAAWLEAVGELNDASTAAAEAAEDAPVGEARPRPRAPNARFSSATIVGLSAPNKNR